MSLMVYNSNKKSIGIVVNTKTRDVVSYRFREGSGSSLPTYVEVGSKLYYPIVKGKMVTDKGMYEEYTKADGTVNYRPASEVKGVEINR